MREFGKIITRKTDLTDAQVQEKYKFPAIIILHDNEDHIVKITHYQKNGTKTIYDFSLSASKQFVTDSIATAIAGLQDNRLEFNAFSDFPAIGDETKFYIDLSEDKIYIWDSNSQTYKNQSWDTATMGSRSQQLSLSSVFRINQDGNANKIDVRAGQLYSQTLDKTWNVSALVSTISDNDYRYVYAKASKTTSTATIYLSKNQILFDSDVNDYYFLVGILHSVVDGVRVLSITIGTTTISGGLVRTGIISSLDGLTSFNLNTGEIKGKITFSSGSSGYENLTDKPDLSSFEQTRDYVNSTLQTDLTDLKNRADGVIESWFYSHTPTLSNLPASNWVTTEERKAHIGDTFTNMQEFVDNATTPDAGKAWRFVKNETTGVFSWSLIANSDSTKALIEAGKAKDTADAKRRVFVSQPYPPYNIGDLWVQGNNGDIMRCKFERLSGSYVATDFEKASKYTDDTAVNNLQIGGRNMLRDSKQPNFNLYDQTIGSIQKLSKAQYPELENEVTYIIVTGGTSAFINLRALLSIDVPKAGELVSLSFKVKNFLDPITLASNQGGRETEINVNNQTTLVKWEGIVGDSYGVVQIQVRALTTNLELYVWDVMYEKGNKATDWTPAPEDVDSAILTAQNSANTANNLLADIANDNILTPSEKQSTKKEWDIIVGEKSVVESQASSLGVSITSYVNAYNSLNSYITPLLANLTINSTIVGSDFRANFKNYYDAKIALLKAVTDKLKSNTDNIQIGGRNFILNSAVEKSGQYNSYQTIYNNNPELVDRAVAVSFDLETDAGNDFQVYSVNSTRLQYYTRFTTQTSGKKRYTFIFYLVGDNSNNPHTLRFETYSNNNVPYIISRAKIELGNKATDWTPAPEDVDSAILTAQNSANTANRLLSDISNDNILTPSEKQSTKKEWDIIVGEKSVVESQANTLGVPTTSYVNAYNSLNSYVSPLLANLTVNSAIIGSDFRANFKNYYDAKIALLKAVTDKLKSNTDVLQTQLDSESAKVINLENKTDFLTGTTIEGNAIATGTLLVGNSDGTNAGITGLGDTSNGVYLWGGGTYQQMVQGLAKKEQRRNGIDIWRHPNGQIGFEIGIKDGRLIFNGYHESGFKLFELDPNRGLVNVSYSQESWTETPFRKLNYSSSTFDESTITNEIKLAIIKQSKMEYYTPPPYSPDSEFGYITTYNLSQNAVGYDYDNGTNPANSSYESLKGMKANYGDRYTNMSNGWYVSSIGEIHMETEWNSYPPPTYTFTVYVYYYQDGKITQTKVVTITK